MNRAIPLGPGAAERRNDCRPEYWDTASPLVGGVPIPAAVLRGRRVTHSESAAPRRVAISTAQHPHISNRKVAYPMKPEIVVCRKAYAPAVARRDRFKTSRPANLFTSFHGERNVSFRTKYRSETVTSQQTAVAFAGDDRMDPRHSQGWWQGIVR